MVYAWKSSDVSLPLDPHRVTDQGDGRRYLGWGVRRVIGIDDRPLQSITNVSRMKLHSFVKLPKTSPVYDIQGTKNL